jgi:hypothetical protein
MATKSGGVPFLPHHDGIGRPEIDGYAFSFSLSFLCM